MIHVQRRLFPNSRKVRRQTRVRIWGGYAEIELTISERLTTRQRRTIATAFFRHLRPWLEWFDRLSVRHEENSSYGFTRDVQRGQKWLDDEKPEVPIRKQALGLEIRLRRQEVGLTQAELAQRAGISRKQVMRIERGQVEAHGSTLARLREGLSRGPLGPIAGGSEGLANPSHERDEADQGHESRIGLEGFVFGGQFAGEVMVRGLGIDFAQAVPGGGDGAWEEARYQ